MKLTIDVLNDMLYLSFREAPRSKFKSVDPRLILEYTDDGELAAIMVLDPSKLVGGRKLQNVDLDFDPPREDLSIEVDDAWMAKARKRLAELGFTGT